MTTGRHQRQDNQRQAFALMLNGLGNQAIDTTLFDIADPPFADRIVRTTWEELARGEYVDCVRGGQYRLTARGWLAALEISGEARSEAFQERVGRVLAAMKRYVKGRRESRVVNLKTLSSEAGEPEGFIFNIVESRASAAGGARRGATWFGAERGRLIEIPVDFNMEPVDVVAALTVPHLDRIQALEERLQVVEEERARYHCPHCDAELISANAQDFPEHHAIVTYERFGCGLLTADGFEEEPCPYSAAWPQLEEFDFNAEENGRLWVCRPWPKTARARRVRMIRDAVGRTKEEAEENARILYEPKVKGKERKPTELW